MIEAGSNIINILRPRLAVGGAVVKRGVVSDVAREARDVVMLDDASVTRNGK